MANVLGSLLVLLRADTAEFSAGMNKASREAKAAGREIEESFSRLGGIVSSALAPFGELGAKISETFAKVGESASAARVSTGAMGAAAAGAVAGLVGMGGALIASAIHAAEVGNQIYEMHQKTGLATNTLEGLMAVTKVTGGSFEGLAASLVRAEANLTKTQLAGDKANRILVGIQGGAKGVAELGLKPMDDRLQIVLKRIFDMNDIGQRNLALTALLGKGWISNSEALEKFATSADHGAALAKQLGLNMDAEKAHAMVIQMNQLKAELDGVSLSIGSKLIPDIAGAVAGMNAWRPVVHGLGQELLDFGKLAIHPGTVGATEAMADFLKQRQGITKALNDSVASAMADARALSADTDQTNKLTGATKQHQTALERAAKASHDFWEEYNAGLTTASEKFPKVISFQEQLNEALHAGQVQMPTGEWRDIPPSARQLMEQIHELHAGEIAKGPPGGLDPFGQMAASADRAILPIQNLNFEMNQIMKIDPNAVSPLRGAFDRFFREVSEDGANTTGKLIESFRNFTGNVSQELASMVVTGRTNFRSLFRGLEQEVLQSGIQAIFAKLAASLIPSTKPTPGPNTATGAASGAAGFIGKIFGGFLQYGGDVTPGKAYVVGERHPEFFVPRQAGEVRPTLAGGAPHQTVVNFHVNGVQDYDSFRRSSSQIMALMQNQMASAYSRNR